MEKVRTDRAELAWIVNCSVCTEGSAAESATATTSAAAAWHCATARKTILQKNLEEAHLAAEPAPAQPAKKLDKAAVAVMAERLSKRKDPPRRAVVPDVGMHVPSGVVMEGEGQWGGERMVPRGMPPGRLVSRQPIKQQVFTLDCNVFGS